MFSVKKEIRVSKLSFSSVSELRSHLMDIVRRNYTEYSVSSQIIKFYPSWYFKSNRGIEGNIIISDDYDHYTVVVKIRNGIVPFLIGVFMIIIISNILTDFDIERKLFLPLIFLPVLLLNFIVFYVSAKTRLKIFDTNIGTVL